MRIRSLHNDKYISSQVVLWQFGLYFRFKIRQFCLVHLPSVIAEWANDLQVCLRLSASERIIDNVIISCIFYFFFSSLHSPPIRAKMVDVVTSRTMPSETEVHVARSFLTKILRSSMRYHQPATSRCICWQIFVNLNDLWSSSLYVVLCVVQYFVLCVTLSVMLVAKTKYSLVVFSTVMFSLFMCYQLVLSHLHFMKFTHYILSLV